MEAVPHVRKLVLAGVVAVAATLGVSAPAYGKGCSHNSSNPPSSVAQYVEQQPTACGSQPTGQGTATRHVPKTIANKIDKQGGKDATLLKNIVSKQSYGAPQTKIKVHKVKVNVRAGHSSKNIPGERATPTSTSKSDPLAASVGVITDGSDSRLIALIVLMVAIAAIVVFSALRRRRVPR